MSYGRISGRLVPSEPRATVAEPVDQALVLVTVIGQVGTQRRHLIASHHQCQRLFEVMLLGSASCRPLGARWP